MLVHRFPVHRETRYRAHSQGQHTGVSTTRNIAWSGRCRAAFQPKASRPSMASFLKRNAWKLSSVPEDDRHSSPMVETGPETAPLKPKLKGITVDPATRSWKIMGLDPSPELLAISMGEHLEWHLGCMRNLLRPCIAAVIGMLPTSRRISGKGMKMEKFMHDMRVFILGGPAFSPSLHHCSTHALQPQTPTADLSRSSCGSAMHLSDKTTCAAFLNSRPELVMLYGLHALFAFELITVTSTFSTIHIEPDNWIGCSVFCARHPWSGPPCCYVLLQGLLQAGSRHGELDNQKHRL